METDEKKYWVWLDEILGCSLERIKEKVKALYEDPDNRPLPFYTSHEASHCRAVEDLIHHLIPFEKYTALTVLERFFLLAAAWLHDIGMLSTVSDIVWGEKLGPDEIRRRHHETSALFIRDHPHRCGVSEADRHFLADLCRYHRRCVDLHLAPEKLGAGHKEHRFRLLAAYLRLADALQVDHGRAPDRLFALCLAYNIPPETKLHWIKSRLVSSIVPDAENHLITVQFQKPGPADFERFRLDPRWVEPKIDAVIHYVLDELRDELASVMYTLTSGAITFYLDIREVDAYGVGAMTMNHLMPLVLNHDVLVWPSASRVMEMILIDLAEIAGYQLRNEQAPQRMEGFRALGEIGENIRRFLGLLEQDVRSHRAGHLGIRSLLEQCRPLLDVDLFTPETFIRLLDDRYQHQRQHRRNIRVRASDCGKEIPLPDGECNLLLFGYSELVIKALCGFRDRLAKKRGLDPRKIYGSEAEMELSCRFRLFICEGQPKTHTACQDRLLYHDGISYALALRRRNFTNLVILPDIILSSVLGRHRLDYLLVGANGFTAEVFLHSAGHGSVIHMLRGIARERPLKPPPRVLLVVSSDKYMPVDAGIAGLRSYSHLGSGEEAYDMDAASDRTYDIDGYSFRAGEREQTRDNIWITRDPRVRADLKTERAHIQFYNPREDAVPFALVDHVLSDVGVFSTTTSDDRKGRADLSAFLAAVKMTLPVDHRWIDRSNPRVIGEEG